MPDTPGPVWRDDLALAMLAAWCGTTPDKLPPEMRAHTCAATAAAWGRVADAARAYLSAPAPASESPSGSANAVPAEAIRAEIAWLASQEDGCLSEAERAEEYGDDDLAEVNRIEAEAYAQLRVRLTALLPEREEHS